MALKSGSSPFSLSGGAGVNASGVDRKANGNVNKSGVGMGAKPNPNKVGSGAGNQNSSVARAVRTGHG